MARQIKSERVVVKIGTATLTKKDGQLDLDFIQSLADQVAGLMKLGKEVIIVTSGAVGAGCLELGIKGKVRDAKVKRACAAVGQGLVMQQYRKAFATHDIKVSQILFTFADFSDRERYLNLKETLNALLDSKVVPIINENDPISIADFDATFGNNDRLAASVASKVEADLLVILSDIEGLYNKNPKVYNDAVLIPEVKDLTPEIEAAAASKSGSTFAVGGMKGKIDAAKICMKSGVSMIICNGKGANVLQKVISNQDIGTLFYPTEKMQGKKSWILQAKSSGSIIVDEGAKKAMLSGKNLLPAGVIDVEGTFETDEIIDIKCNGKTFAKAITDYSSDHLLKTKRKKSADVEAMLGSICPINVTRSENVVFVK